MFTLAFFKGLAERAISTFAQSLAGSIIVATPIVEQPWLVALGIAGTATLLSVLKSFSVPSFTAGSEPTTGPETAITADSKAE